MFEGELRKRILRLYIKDNKTLVKILEGDADTIRNMQRENEITAAEIVDAYENNRIEELYKEAKRKVEINQLYHDLCIELAKNHVASKSK